MGESKWLQGILREVPPPPPSPKPLVLSPTSSTFFSMTLQSMWPMDAIVIFRAPRSPNKHTRPEPKRYLLCSLSRGTSAQQGLHGLPCATLVTIGPSWDQTPELSVHWAPFTRTLRSCHTYCSASMQGPQIRTLSGPLSSPILASLRPFLCLNLKACLPVPGQALCSYFGCHLST